MASSVNRFLVWTKVSDQESVDKVKINSALEPYACIVRESNAGIGRCAGAIKDGVIHNLNVSFVST